MTTKENCELRQRSGVAVQENDETMNVIEHKRIFEVWRNVIKGEKFDSVCDFITSQIMIEDMSEDEMKKLKARIRSLVQKITARWEDSHHMRERFETKYASWLQRGFDIENLPRRLPSSKRRSHTSTSQCQLRATQEEKMLPLSNRDISSRDKISTRLVDQINGWLRLIFSDRNSRNLLLFLILNLSFAFVELIYGVWTNSLGLISDSFHMFFDCTGLLAGLVASVITKWRANDKYSFGYVRAEVLAGFVNGLFLLFIAFFIMSEAVERAIEPPEVKHERLFVVSVLGFLVNLIGIYAFQHGHAHGGSHGHGHSHSHGNKSNHGHSHASNNHGHFHSQPDDNSANSHIMKGVFLHILADTLGSVGVIISSVLVQAFGWMRADPICSMFIALLIALSVISLIKDSIYILMQRQPVALDNTLPQCYQKVMQLVGVYSIQEPHFWTLCSDYYVGGIKLEVSKEADPKYIISHTQMIFSAVGVRQIYIQLDYATT